MKLIMQLHTVRYSLQNHPFQPPSARIMSGVSMLFGGSVSAYKLKATIRQQCAKVYLIFFPQFYIFLFNYFLVVFICSLCNKDSSSCTFRACVMPKDCQTSDWSSWSPCSKTCRSTDLSPGYRLRSRIMTQIPVGGGKQCPTLEEKEACNIIGDLLPNCPRQFLTFIISFLAHSSQEEYL